MRKLFSLFVVSLIAVLMLGACGSKENEKTNYTAEITINGAKDGDVVAFKNWEDGKWVTIDSATLKNGKAEMKGYVDYPTLYYLYYNKIRLSPVFVEPGKITIKIDKSNLHNVVVEGSKSQREFEYFNKEISGVIDDQIKKLGNQYGMAARKNDTRAMDSLTRVYESLENRRKDEMITYAEKNPKSVVPAFIIYQYSYQFKLPDLERAAKAFDPSINGNKYVKSIKERVETLKKVQVGQPFIDITENDTAGNPVSLSSVVKKNKYVLVDFWASWCKPCRAENPNVVAAYKKYHDKGFTVFGVSFDKSKDAWIKAIKDDGLNWTHVSDLKGWGNEAGKLYGIQSIPQNILIGPDGKIVARNIRGEELQKKLAELMP